MAVMMASRMVARLAGPLPVRLAALSSLNVTSRMVRFDGPVLSDQAGQVLGGDAGAGHAGDGVDGLAGGLAGGDVLAPAGYLDGLAGPGEVQPADVSGL